MAESSSRRSTRQALLRSHEAASPWSAYSSSLYGPVLITTPAASRGSSASIQSIYAAKMKSSTTMFDNDHHHRRQKRLCMCAPTTHPGSFKCSLHKSTLDPGQQQQQQRFAVGQDSSNHLNNARRYAMRNSLVRIGVNVQGDFVKRALAIRHTSNQQRRRVGFQKKPSRLSNNVSLSSDE